MRAAPTTLLVPSRRPSLVPWPPLPRSRSITAFHPCDHGALTAAVTVLEAVRLWCGPTSAASDCLPFPPFPASPCPAMDLPASRLGHHRPSLNRALPSLASVIQSVRLRREGRTCSLVLPVAVARHIVRVSPSLRGRNCRGPYTEAHPNLKLLCPGAKTSLASP